MILGRIGAWFERTLRFELLSGVLRVAFERGNSFGQQLLGDLQTVKNFLGSSQVGPIFDAPWAPVFHEERYTMHTARIAGADNLFVDPVHIPVNYNAVYATDAQ